MTNSESVKHNPNYRTTKKGEVRSFCLQCGGEIGIQKLDSVKCECAQKHNEKVYKV